MWSAYQEEARNVRRSGASKMHSALLTMLLRLRQCCDHFLLTQPSTRQRAEDDAATDDETDSARVAEVVERSVGTTH